MMCSGGWRARPPVRHGAAAVPRREFDAAETRRHLEGEGLSQRSADACMALYGGRSRAVVAEAQDDRDLLKVVHEASGAIGAEMVFAVRHEFARTLTDVLARRVLLAFEPGHGLEAAGAIAALLGAKLRLG